MLSPKQIVTICFAISILISAPLFATDIPPFVSTADCKNNPLQTYSGTSNLQADWQANEIYLYWYDGDEELDVPEESWSCVYDGTLTPPPAPTKTGYTFKGWRVRCELYTLMDDANVDISINGTNYGYTRINGAAGLNENTYGLTTYPVDDNHLYPTAEWAVTFSYGTVKGISYCRKTNGIVSRPENQWCWCFPQQYIALNGDKHCKIRRGGGSFLDEGSANDCANNCAQHCAEGARNSQSERERMFYQQTW